MTDPDQSYRRPQPEMEEVEHNVSSCDGVCVDTPSVDSDPVILDSGFHQSIWTPWEEPVDAGSTSQRVKPSPPPRQGVARRAMVWLGVAGVLALVTALLIPQLMQASTWWLEPPVKDLSGEPEIAWSVAAAEPCDTELDEDHVIMFDPDRVWSLDLRDGRTRWSVDLPGRRETVNCLPGANLVAVSDVDRLENTVVSISLLDGATGRKIDELPGRTTARVIPLGATIGLIDRSNMLRAVEPGILGKPLWSQRLPGGTDELSEVVVMPMDKSSVQLWYSTSGGETFMPVLSLDSGEAPTWAQGSWTEAHFYHRLADVALSYSVTEDVAVSVLDLEGHELWGVADASLVVAGARLYAMSTSITRPGSRLPDLREVDPRSGKPVNDYVYTGPFHVAVAAPLDRVAVFQSDSVMILDETLQSQDTVPHINGLTTYVGQKLLYIGGDEWGRSDDERAQLTAIDPIGSRMLWQFDLEPKQHISRFGRHLVVLDDDGRTIHGLRSRS